MSYYELIAGEPEPELKFSSNLIETQYSTGKPKQDHPVSPSGPNHRSMPPAKAIVLFAGKHLFTCKTWSPGKPPSDANYNLWVAPKPT